MACTNGTKRKMSGKNLFSSIGKRTHSTIYTLGEQHETENRVFFGFQRNRWRIIIIGAISSKV